MLTNICIVTGGWHPVISSEYVENATDLITWWNSSIGIQIRVVLKIATPK